VARVAREGEPYPHQTTPYLEDGRDARFDPLCTLYLQADGKQRAQIPTILAREESTRAYVRIGDWRTDPV
jgi:hypothetical protein